MGDLEGSMIYLFKVPLWHVRGRVDIQAWPMVPQSLLPSHHAMAPEAFLCWEADYWFQ